MVVNAASTRHASSRTFGSWNMVVWSPGHRDFFQRRRQFAPPEARVKHGGIPVAGGDEMDYGATERFRIVCPRSTQFGSIGRPLSPVDPYSIDPGSGETLEMSEESPDALG